MAEYYSNGKLLLTAEYVVLDGAKALALPTKYGQSLTVESIDKAQLIWKSMDHKGNVWFEDEFSFGQIAFPFLQEYSQTLQQHCSISKTLLDTLYRANKLNKQFLSHYVDSGKGLTITTKLDFPENWGLGSSSTLINNIANWAKVDAYKLLELTFGGSGYDIACAQHNHPIVYQNNVLEKASVVNTIDFNPSFKDQLFFVHLNQKQNSRDGIERYNSIKKNLSAAISEINAITEAIIMSNLIDLPTVKSSLFSDFPGAIKSLGAWGGDFVLATGNDKDMGYFKDKGYQTILPYPKMIL